MPLFLAFGEVAFSHDEVALVAWAVVCSFAAAGGIFAIYKLSRRNPSIEDEIDIRIDRKLDGFQTHFTSELDRLAREIHNSNEERKADRSAAEARDKAINCTLQNSFNDIFLAIGRLEGNSNAFTKIGEAIANASQR